MRYFFKILFSCMVISGIVFSQDDVSGSQGAVTKVATSAANYLKVESGIRGIAMGGAHVAAGRGLSGIFYNPASIAYIERSEAYFAKTNLYAGITNNTISYGTRMTPTDYFGVHLFYMDSGDMEVTTEQSPDGTGEYFNVLQLTLRFVYGKQLTDRLRVGGSLKYLRENIHTAFMHSFVFDLGSNFDTGVYGLMLGMSVSNFGPDVQFQGEALHVGAENSGGDDNLSKISDKFSVPLVFRLGLHKESQLDLGLLGDHRLNMAIDAINPIDYTVHGGMGVEYSWNSLLFGRLGTSWGHDTRSWSLGGAVRWKLIDVDFAYVNYGDLGKTLQFGIGLRF